MYLNVLANFYEAHHQHTALEGEELVLNNIVTGIESVNRAIPAHLNVRQSRGRLVEHRRQGQWAAAPGRLNGRTVRVKGESSIVESGRADVSLRLLAEHRYCVRVAAGDA